MLQRRNIDTNASTGPFKINPDLDLDALARTYAEEGKVRIYGLLADGAVQLHQYFESHREWIQLITTPEGVTELDPAARAAISPEQWRDLETAALVGARTGFQYRYQALRVPTEREIENESDLLSCFSRLMKSEPMLALLRRVTGHSQLAFTDGQATAYDHGDFLTGHDDDVPGKGRLAAYVFGLTPRWRLEWGGLLLFHGEMDRTVSGMVPRFNVLDLFEVPRQHSVSQVTRAAPYRRYAVTGWLRGGCER